MKTKKTFGLILLSAALTLSACGGSDQSEDSGPAPSDSVSDYDDEFVDETLSDEPGDGVYEDENAEYDITTLTLRMVWDSYNVYEQDELCYEYNAYPETAIQMVMDSDTTGEFQEQKVRDFFEGEC